MSDRPTISVYIDGHIADIGYYRNWDPTDLFFEAIAIAALFGKCTSIQEYSEKKYGKQKVSYSLEPEVFENTEENLKSLEACSEFPILIDLTAKCIYRSRGAKEREKLYAIPSAFDKHDNYDYRKEHRRTGLSRVETLLAGLSYTYDPTAFEEYEEPIPAVSSISMQDVCYLLSYFRIPLSQVDMDEVLDMYLEYDELKRHLSTTMVDLLKKERRIRQIP